MAAAPCDAVAVALSGALQRAAPGPAGRSLRRSRFSRGRSSYRSRPACGSPRRGIAAPTSPRHGMPDRLVDLRHDCWDIGPACVPGTVWGTASSLTAKFRSRRLACPSREVKSYPPVAVAPARGHAACTLPPQLAHTFPNQQFQQSQSTGSLRRRLCGFRHMTNISMTIQPDIPPYDSQPDGRGAATGKSSGCRPIQVPTYRFGGSVTHAPTGVKTNQMYAVSIYQTY